MKPVEEMTMEEVMAERAALAAARADTEFEQHVVSAAEVVHEEFAEDSIEESTPPAAPTAVAQPLPHLHIAIEGRTLEARKPDEPALVALSMSSVPSVPNETKMRIFTQFLTYHLSPASFADVLEAMMDPDSGVTMQSVIVALTELREA